MLGTNQRKDGMHTSEMLVASANLRERGNMRELRILTLPLRKSSRKTLTLKLTPSVTTKQLLAKVNPVVKRKPPLL